MIALVCLFSWLFGLVLFVCLFICLSVYCLLVCWFVGLFVCLFVCFVGQWLMLQVILAGFIVIALILVASL